MGSQERTPRNRFGLVTLEQEYLSQAERELSRSASRDTYIVGLLITDEVPLLVRVEADGIGLTPAIGIDQI